MNRPFLMLYALLNAVNLYMILNNHKNLTLSRRESSFYWIAFIFTGLILVGCVTAIIVN